ncbi:MAG: DNA translocase FtsK 4TM domain-containing protein [Nitrospirota bacterium]
MAQQKDNSRFNEIIGIVLVAAGLLILISLMSYHSDDPSFSAASQQAGVKNWAGAAGAYLSDSLFQLFGGGAYLFPFFAFIFGWKKALNIESKRFYLELTGAVIFLLSLSAFLTITYSRITVSYSGNIPAGGIAGDIIAYLLLKSVAKAGAYIIVITLGIVSLIISTDFSLIRFSQWFWDKGLEAYDKVKTEKIIKKEQERRWKEEEDIVREKEIFYDKEPPKIVETKKIKQEHFTFAETKKIGDYQLPSLNLLNDPPASARKVSKEELLMNSSILEKKLLDYGIEGRIINVHPGPVITMYEFEPAPGVKVNKIVGLADDLALAMRALSVRIVAPIPGKSVVGIEIPNNIREDVFFKDILSSDAFSESRSRLPLALGKDIFGNPVVADLTRMPHLLVAGATGSGKSVALNSMICSLLFAATPDDVKLLMIDPKMLELSAYEGIPHLISPVITETKEAAGALQRIVGEMQRRYRLLSEKGVRNIDGYNNLIDSETRMHDSGSKTKKIEQDEENEIGYKKEDEAPSRLPYIVVIIDELADLMMTSAYEVESAIARLAQMARAAGIHIILATQRPSVDVLTGVIKANFSARISFQVSSKTDSRTILDANGAEQLLGRGDMLFMPPGTARIERIHGSFITEDEMKRIVDFLKKQAEPVFEAFMSAPLPDENGEGSVEDERDEFYQKAVDLVSATGQASISMIQRKMRIGYNRAARMIEMMEEDGIVSSPNAGKREVIHRRSL